MPTNYSSTPTTTTDTIQRYGSIMWDVIRTYFPQLWSAPNSFYIMMATMELESGFKIWHGKTNPSPNHAKVSTATGVGKSYWTDGVIVPLRLSNDINVLTNVSEGLSAKALMGTLGMYQVRNCRESNSIIVGNYRDVAESLSLMVNPGESITAKFPNNDTGARNSMVLGCIIMENKYKNRLRKNSPDIAMKLAVGDYVGKAGSKDVLGATPEMRVGNIFSGSTGINKNLLVAKVFSDRIDYYRPLNIATGQIETKTTSVANTDNTATGVGGCNRFT